jgi:hypothetical protein
MRSTQETLGSVRAYVFLAVAALVLLAYVMAR